MVFRRRVPLSFGQKLRNVVAPKGGWGRSLKYARLRLSRIPDDPARIARGLAAGVFVGFTPLFGLHLPLAVGLAFAINGNVLAALMGTMISNPLTLPFMAVLSLDLGRAILGTGDGVPFSQIMTAFGHAGDEIGHNLWALVSPQPMHWDKLALFLRDVFLPYLVGSIGPGLIGAGLAYVLCVPALDSYHSLRTARRLERRKDAAMARHGTTSAKGDGT